MMFPCLSCSRWILSTPCLVWRGYRSLGTSRWRQWIPCSACPRTWCGGSSFTQNCWANAHDSSQLNATPHTSPPPPPPSHTPPSHHDSLLVFHKSFEWSMWWSHPVLSEVVLLLLLQLPNNRFETDLRKYERLKSGFLSSTPCISNISKEKKQLPFQIADSFFLFFFFFKERKAVYV